VNPRIERVHASLLRVPLDRRMRAYGSDTVSVLFVRVVDVDGSEGTGFTYTLNEGLESVRTMVDATIGPLTIGTDPEDWDATRNSIARQTRRLGPDAAVPALSAVDIAIWDLRAQRAGLPLFALLGRSRTEVPMYGSGRSSNRLSVDELVAGTVSYVDDGLTAVKLRVGAREPDQDVSRVAAVRAAVGDRIVLMVDANEQLTPAAATDLARGLEPLGLAWIEEPFPAEDVLAHAALHATGGIPVAVGEHLASAAHFAEYARERAAGIWQPDAALGGGITGMLEVAALAHDHGIPLAYHSLPELNVHLAMGDPAAVWVEHFPILDPLIAEPLPVDGGVVTAPDRTGHGIRWDAEAIRALT
jgi:L-alanine-DL-glutamate epimerase-like enolase superfamily enzyme